MLNVCQYHIAALAGSMLTRIRNDSKKKKAQQSNFNKINYFPNVKAGWSSLAIRVNESSGLVTCCAMMLQHVLKAMHGASLYTIYT